MQQQAVDKAKTLKTQRQSGAIQRESRTRGGGKAMRCKDKSINAAVAAMTTRSSKVRFGCFSLLCKCLQSKSLYYRPFVYFRCI